MDKAGFLVNLIFLMGNLAWKFLVALWTYSYFRSPYYKKSKMVVLEKGL